ncbi:MAG: hypothetical protein Q3M30_02605 [Candidatus Electrothrix sp. Rat3]|nr:hypothetical protein [Candidatus Electrothrix rattekaaiensis]
MKISIGNPVTGDDFFNREKEQEQIWRKLERNHIMLLAPRRIGKTSLMHRLCATAEEHKFHATLTSFAPCEDEMGCVREIIKAVSKEQKAGGKFKEVLSRAISHIKGVKLSVLGVGGGIDLQTENRADWREVGEALTKTLAELEGMHLICVDELPVFILKLLEGENGRDRARSFLYWFRDLRQKYRLVRWILAGSIGMDTVASRFRLGDTVNDLDPFPLGAFSEATADLFLARLAESYDLQLSAIARQYMIERVGWPVPYYLQLLFDKLISQGNSPTKAMIDTAFEELLSPAYKVHFDYWRQRLKEELGSPEDGHAVRLLNAVCRDRNGASRSVLSQVLQERIQEPEQREETMRYLLDVLENDGYLVSTGDRCRFRLEWLREYWLRRVA